MKAAEVRTMKNKKYMKTEKILADSADQQGTTEGGCVRQSKFVSGKADLCQISLIFSISNLSSLIVLIMMLTKGG